MNMLLAVDWTVDDVLTRYRETASVFVQRRMACVGCPMSRFETLQDAARIYGLPVAELMRELKQAISAGEGEQA